ncbi:MAG: cytochrome c [Pseudomonadota bacterium]|nr:cytochrome c [Pseudomonadota bacterium]
MFATGLAIAAELQGSAESGGELYRQNCESCHGRDMITSSTLVFDLRKFPRNEAARFRASVLNGKGGMPSWKDTLSDQDVADLWAYVQGASVRQ